MKDVIDKRPKNIDELKASSEYKKWLENVP